MAKFIVELEHTDWQVVLNFLSAAPFRDVAPVINKITQQLSAPPPAGNGEIHRDTTSSAGA